MSTTTTKIAALAALMAAAPLGAQTQATDPALRMRAREMAAKGVPAPEIERRLRDYARERAEARAALRRGGRTAPADDEVDAAAVAMKRGVDGAEVSALARTGPSGRSLAVPLFVVSSLVDRGLPADSALARVAARLRARATDRELEQGERGTADRGRSAEAPGAANRPAVTGRDLAALRRGTNGSATRGKSASVPANPGGGRSAKDAGPGTGTGNPGKGKGKGRKP